MFRRRRNQTIFYTAFQKFCHCGAAVYREENQANNQTEEWNLPQWCKSSASAGSEQSQVQHHVSLFPPPPFGVCPPSPHPPTHFLSCLTKYCSLPPLSKSRPLSYCFITYLRSFTKKKKKKDRELGMSQSEKTCQNTKEHSSSHA